MPERPELFVSADLDFTLDLGSGPIRGRVEGDGQVLRVVTDQPDAVWQAASEVPEIGTSALPRLADELANNGIRLEVVGPQGRVATVGSGASSRLGRLVTGSSAVQPGDTRAVIALLLARVRRTGRTLILPGALVAVATAAVVVAARRRR